MDEDEPSELEKLCQNVRQQMQELSEQEDCDDVSEGTEDEERISLENEDILFELEESKTGDLKAKVAHSPTGASDISEVSTSPEDSNSPPPPLFKDHNSHEAVLGPMAASVHATDGYLWRNIKARNLSKRHHKPAVKQANAYPPPVRTAAPDAGNDMLGDLNSADWALFMQLFSESLDEVLRDGRWKQPTKESGIPMSCPRF